MSATTEISAPTCVGRGRIVGMIGRTWYRMPRGFLGLVMLFTGAAGLIYEYVLSTVFTYQLGSSIEQFSVTIGIMFVMMGIGGLVQPKLQGPLPLYFIMAELVLVLLGGFAPIALQWAFAEMQSNFALVKFAYPALIGLLIGVEIPLAMRINEQFQQNLSKNIASTWAWDYIGGAVGVIAWIWMLHHYVPITYISFYVAVANLAVAILSLVFFWYMGLLPRCSSRVFSILTILAVVFATLFGAANVDSWGKVIGQKLYDDPIVFQTTTKYQHIVLTEGKHPQDPVGKNYQLFLNGNKQFASADERIYHEHLVHPAMNMAATRKRVLVLGGGDGLAVREILKYKDVEHITLVDLDPGMIELATSNEIMRQLNNNAFGDARVYTDLKGVTDTGDTREVHMDTGQVKNVNCQEVTKDGQDVADCDGDPITQKVADVNIYTLDADKFVSARTEPYDIVIVDLPDPNSVELAKLYSQEFYAKVKRTMSPDGMVVVQATSPYHAKETYLCILRTMAAAGLNVLPYHANVPSFGEWGWILGSPSLRSTELLELTKDLEPFPVETKEVNAINMTGATIFNKGQLQSRNTQISTLMEPVVHSYYAYEGWQTD